MLTSSSSCAHGVRMTIATFCFTLTYYNAGDSQSEHYGHLGPDNSLLLWNCPVHCRMFSGILGLYPWDTTSISALSCDNQKCLQTLPNGCLEGLCAKISWLRATGLKKDRPLISSGDCLKCEEVCFLIDPKFPPLSHCLNLGHSPLHDPSTCGISFRLIKSTTGARDGISSPEACNSSREGDASMKSMRGGVVEAG